MEIKKDIETIKNSIERFASFLDTASEDLQKFARKDDLDILAKQMRMFQPSREKIMGTIDQVINMRREGRTDEDIISNLRRTRHISKRNK